MERYANLGGGGGFGGPFAAIGNLVVAVGDCLWIIWLVHSQNRWNHSQIRIGDMGVDCE